MSLTALEQPANRCEIRSAHNHSKRKDQEDFPPLKDSYTEFRRCGMQCEDVMQISPVLAQAH